MHSRYTGAPYFAAISAMRAVSCKKKNATSLVPSLDYGIGTRLWFHYDVHSYSLCRGLTWVMCFVLRLQPLWSNPIAQSWLFTQYCEHSALKIACSILHRSLQSEPPLPCRSDQCSQSSEAISSWLPRLHALVIGPGLGRDPTIMNTVKSVIAAAKQQQKDIVLDAVSWLFSIILQNWKVRVEPIT